jgi:tripartite-type tricarboxylate transporter receptor subunit TctC
MNKGINFRRTFWGTLSVGVGMLLFLILWQNVIHAESFPTREIELVNAYSPGGGAEMFCRLVGGEGF